MTELILRGGVLFTQNPKSPTAQALAVAAGKIRAVGSDSEILSLRRPGTRVVDLAGRTLIPGFIDAHAHIWKIGHLLTGMVDLRRTVDIPGITSLLHQAAAAARPGTWIQGRGFNESRLAEGRRPDRHDLDAVIPDRPVVLTRTCGHSYACNTLALTLAGIARDTPDPPGGVIERDASGQLTGLLHETAMGLINRRMPPPSPSDYSRMILAALHHQLALGRVLQAERRVAARSVAGDAVVAVLALRLRHREQDHPAIAQLRSSQGALIGVNTSSTIADLT